MRFWSALRFSLLGLSFFLRMSRVLCVLDGMGFSSASPSAQKAFVERPGRSGLSNRFQNKGLADPANPCVFLVELRGVEPLTS